MRQKCKLFFMAIVLLMLPLTGYTMSYNLGYVEGMNDQQQITLHTQTQSLSAFIGETEADLFTDKIVSGGIGGTSADDNELAMSTSPTGPINTDDCLATDCYSNPEVGWRGSL